MPQPDPCMPVADADNEATQDWYFTFGHGQRGYSASEVTRIHQQEAAGFPLHNRYVVIHGTYMSARAEMFRVFGPVWSMPYASRAQAGVDEFDLVELVITEDGKRVSS